MKIQLLKPHSHAGREYQPGAILELDRDAAEWLIAIGSAKPAETRKKEQDK